MDYEVISWKRPLLKKTGVQIIGKEACLKKNSLFTLFYKITVEIITVNVTEKQQTAFS